MSTWSLITYILAGGAGAIVFLKFVCDEIVIKNRVLGMRVEIAEEMRDKLRAQREAEALTAEMDARVELAKPAA